MHDYYVHARAPGAERPHPLTLRRGHRFSGGRQAREIINEDFEVQGRTLTAAARTFKARPRALRLFVILANRKDIDRVRASTIRMIRKSLDLIDDAFRPIRKTAPSWRCRSPIGWSPS